ncbi:HECT-domain-containing protein [Lentinula raphanica]|uniref:HECT-type E3 ubiquitin transferase n=1 Tax=Lentinula raphanica TaxID=153919 RepID=A0AA38PDL7_9AGAR|nr:HECT-domain-containing protein [Lentinula raphanica]KAJ3840980.1 HECT-domain-containing protein [Lentinula raphanica]
MLPLFDTDRRRRQINLGGASSSTSHTSIIDQAKLRREERIEHKRRSDSAVKVQAWWRGTKEHQRVRQELRRNLEDALDRGDLLQLNTLRMLVIVSRTQTNDTTLSHWSHKLLQYGADHVFDSATSQDTGTSYVVLIKQIILLLLQELSRNAQFDGSVAHLTLLNLLLSPGSKSTSSPNRRKIVQAFLAYSLSHGYYSLLASAMTTIPVEAKSSPALPPLVTLFTLPFTALETTSVEYASAIQEFFVHILTIHLLPNRLPLPTLTQLSSHLPLTKMNLLYAKSTGEWSSSSLAQFLSGSATAITIQVKIHLISNLLAFTPPRYGKLPGPAFAAYLRLLGDVLNHIPSGALEGPSAVSSKNRSNAMNGYGSDSDDDHSNIRVTIVSSFNTPSPPPLPVLDPRTLKRLLVLPSPAHILSILEASKSLSSSRYPLITFIHSLSGVWPSKQDELLTHLWSWNGGGLVREIWRGWVRGGGLGSNIVSPEPKAANAMDVDSGASSSRSSHLEPLRPVVTAANKLRGVAPNSDEDPWAPLLLLADLYSHGLVTMGDDEFFSSSTLTGIESSTAHRNPLTLDEISTFTRQLLNIAWVLWMHGGDLGNESSSSFASSVPQPLVRFSWIEIREKVTRCLLAINARDARKPFMPPGGWLVMSDESTMSESNGNARAEDMRLTPEMAGFVEAAIFEAQELMNASNPSSEAVSIDAIGSPRRGFRTYSKRKLNYLTPRLGVLNNIPFAIPFHVRVAIFRNFVHMDMVALSSSHSRDTPPINPFTNMNTFMNDLRSSRAALGQQQVVTVRRGSVAQDGFDHLGDADLKNPIRIVFIDQFGAEEAGIDGGGVFKEFFTSLCKEVFDTDRGLWLSNEKNELYPNPHAYATEAHSLSWYRFIGRILGKAMYEGILVDVAFASFFLAKWLGRQSFLDDLASLDPDLYKGLVFLKHHTGNFEDLSLNFTMEVEEFGTTKTIELIRNGSNIAVTKENRLQYIYLVCHFKLSKQIKLQSEAFFEGLSEMIEPKWIQMFNQQELQILLGGVNSPIDLNDLRAHTNYGGLYDDNEPTVVAFWNVVNTFDQEQRRALLRFVTSCSRPPLLGFKELTPNFAIRDAGSDQHRLPTSSTCVNLLKLPRYRDERVMRSKLLQAIMSNAGFDLS